MHNSMQALNSVISSLKRKDYILDIHKDILDALDSEKLKTLAEYGQDGMVYLIFPLNLINTVKY